MVAKTNIDPMDLATVADHPWKDNYVLSANSMPLVTTLRYTGKNRCSCEKGEVHKDLFFLNEHVVGPHLLGKSRKIPEIKTCWCSTSIFDKLPREVCLGPSRRYLKEITDLGDFTNILMKNTYWFARFAKKGTRPGSLGRPLRRLYMLLTEQTDMKLTASQLLASPITPQGFGRFSQMLHTIEGVITSIYIAAPHVREINSWDYFDRVCHSLLCNLCEDYFELSKLDTYVSFYKSLKAFRKQIKYHTFHETKYLTPEMVPRNMTFYVPVIGAMEKKNGLSVFMGSILCQTRAAGLPPPFFQKETFRKFKETVLTEPKELSDTDRSEIVNGVYDVWDSISLDERNFKRRLSSQIKRMKVSLSDSAEFNIPTSRGGKYEAARLLLEPFLFGKEVCHTIDLETGETGDPIEPIKENIGEILFYESLRRVVTDDKYMSVRYSGVSEPGKTRGITVSCLEHAMVLHPISHLISDVLSALPSSRAGLKAANHGWDFFKRLSHKNPAASFIFDKSIYSNFCFSTDWTTATDYCSHDSSAGILHTFMGKRCLGVPSYYRDIAIALIASPREVHPPKWAESGTFVTRRGILMGDPLTKSVLHLHHLVIKSIAKSRIVYHMSQT